MKINSSELIDTLRVFAKLEDSDLRRIVFYQAANIIEKFTGQKPLTLKQLEKMDGRAILIQPLFILPSECNLQFPQYAILSLNTGENGDFTELSLKDGKSVAWRLSQYGKSWIAYISTKMIHEGQKKPEQSKPCKVNKTEIMDIKKAIQYFQTENECIEYETWKPQTYPQYSANKLAIKVLQEEEKREEGCAYCDPGNIAHYSKGNIPNYCKHCGRKLDHEQKMY